MYVCMYVCEKVTEVFQVDTHKAHLSVPKLHQSQVLYAAGAIKS